MKAGKSNTTSARQILKTVPGFSDQDAVLTPLLGGITNRNYKVRIQGERFVLRIGGKNTRQLGINRTNEHKISSIAAKLGIGAQMIYSNPRKNLQITRFINGKRITATCAAKPETLRRIVKSIQKIHSGPKFPGAFSPFRTVRSYHLLALKHKVALPPLLDKALELMSRIEKALRPLPQLRPCHNDLLASNLIDDGRAIRIIDWEYAAMGDPYFDLGNFAVNQKLSQERCRFLLREYSGQFRPEDFARLNFYRLASHLRESFWGFLQMGLSKIDFDFRDYALIHLKRYRRDSRELKW